MFDAQRGRCWRRTTWTRSYLKVVSNCVTWTSRSTSRTCNTVYRCEPCSLRGCGAKRDGHLGLNGAEEGNRPKWYPVGCSQNLPEESNVFLVGSTVWVTYNNNSPCFQSHCIVIARRGDRAMLKALTSLLNIAAIGIGIVVTGMLSYHTFVVFVARVLGFLHDNWVLLGLEDSSKKEDEIQIMRRFRKDI